MKFTQQFLSTWKKVPVSKRLGLLTFVVVAVIGTSMAYSRVTAPTWVVLYGNVDDAQASAVLAKLDAKGIQHQMGGNGTRVLVPKDQLVTARLSLAADGVGGRSMPEGWAIMDKEGLATSDLKQRVDYQRALEGELALTLMGIDAVDRATVHLTLPEKPIYAGSTTATAKPTASVLLELKRPLSADETDTVANLVASAVEGLAVSNVTVASSDGTILHAAGDNPSSGGTVTSTKALKATQEFETAQSQKLTTLARQLTQRSDASVVVKAELSFDETSTETETVDPTQQVPSAEHKLTEDWTGTGSPAGGTVGVDGGPLPTTAANANGKYTKEDKTTTYAGGKTVTKTVQTPGSVKRMSVAVVVPYDATAGDPTFDTADVARVVGAAAALDAKRGDTIEVATVAAGPVPTTVAPATTTPPVATGVPTTVLGGVGGGIFLFALVLLMKRRKRKRKLVATIGPALEQGEVAALTAAYALPHEQRGGTDTSKAETASIRADLDRMANETPESLAALLSSWLTKG